MIIKRNPQLVIPAKSWDLTNRGTRAGIQNRLKRSTYVKINDSLDSMVERVRVFDHALKGVCDVQPDLIMIACNILHCRGRIVNYRH